MDEKNSWLGFLCDDGAFHKQKNIFLSAKNPSSRWLVPGTQRRRWWKKVGLGFKTPKSAIQGTYIDKKCPFTSDVSIRGRILRGIIIRNKMFRTVVVRRNYLHFIKKYKRYEKRHKNWSVHVSPCFDFSIGDEVVFGQCRPLSKTVSFNVLQVIPKSKRAEAAKKEFEKF